jgi:hypothetical protein
MAYDYAGLHLGDRCAPWCDVVQVHNKQGVLQGRKGLAGTKLGLDEDFRPTQQVRKSELWSMFKEAKVVGKHAFWHVVELFVDDILICSPSFI